MIKSIEMFKAHQGMGVSYMLKNLPNGLVIS